MVWLAFLIQSIVVLCVAYWAQQFERTQWDWNKFLFAGIITFFGFPSTYQPQHSVNRMGFIFVLFGCTLWVTIVTAELTSFGVIRIFNVKIETITDVMQGDFDLAGDPFAISKLRKFDERKEMKECKFESCLEHLKLNERSAIAISNAFMRTSGLLGTSTVYCLKRNDAIHEYAVKFLVRQNLSYETELNDFILRTGQSGLITKWLKSINFRHSVKAPMEMTEITLENQKVLMVISCLMILLATIMLVFEIIVRSQVMKDERGHFWCYVERLIDPDRHYFLDKIPGIQIK